MSRYQLPTTPVLPRLEPSQVQIVASGDMRSAANMTCWDAQSAVEDALGRAVASLGFEIVHTHAFDPDSGHGFIDSQRMGMDVFARIDPDARVIVAEAVWQYSHHVLAGLTTHRGPILTVANWSGRWPGLVGLLNLNASLTKAGVAYSTLWSETFEDDWFLSRLKRWLETGVVKHPLDHVRPLSEIAVPDDERALGRALARDLQHHKAILGVFDEGCMGMFNAIIPDHLLHPTGVFKERLSQSALHAATLAVPDEEGRAVYRWLLDAGMTFNLGTEPVSELTEEHVLLQCRMYIAALRMADQFRCDAIGIQYQLGLVDCLPASDLVEAMLNDSLRPPVYATGTNRELYAGAPLPHFNEVDECAGLDGLMTFRIHTAMDLPVENTLHDLRWADADRSGTVDGEVWVLEISGAVPASHFADGWAGARGERQPAMYFARGGSSVKGVSRPGEIVWSRIYVAEDALFMDIGRGSVVDLPREETERRWAATTSEWPIMHAVFDGVDRNQMMAKHKSNHIQVVYGNDIESADRAMFAKAAMADALGIRVNVCGTRRDGSAW